MDSSYDSDASEGMQDLVRRGFAIRREREIDHVGDTRVQFHDMDVSHVQRPLTLSVSAGVASTHGLTLATLETVTAAGRNSLNLVRTWFIWFELGLNLFRRYAAVLAQ